MRMVPFFSEVGERALKDMTTVIVKNGRSIPVAVRYLLHSPKRGPSTAPVSGARA